MEDELYTIGRSIHAIAKFLDLLTMHGITAVADVRSHPYSRYNPQFNHNPIKQVLVQHRILYLFLGKEQRLMERLRIKTEDLFLSPEALIEKAYDLQSEKIAYTKDTGV